MELIKWDFFSGTIAPPRSRKHILTPIWVREKNKRRLLKIEETCQEEVSQGETSRGEASQEAMAVPMDDETSQKLFKKIEEQSDILKKMREGGGGRLTKLEMAKLKKPIHVEIHDEEKGEDWDERDKAEYERKKAI